MSTLIEKFQKNSFEEVQVSYNQFNKNDLIDIRVFSKNDKDEYVRTKKGVSINIKLLPELEKAIQKQKSFWKKKVCWRNNLK